MVSSSVAGVVDRRLCRGDPALAAVLARLDRDFGTKAALLGAFAVAVAVIGFALTRRSRKMRVSAILLRLQDTTAQIRVRGAMLLLLLMVVLAEHLGLETILGAFVAGAIVSVVDRDATRTHPQFRSSSRRSATGS